MQKVFTLALLMVFILASAVPVFAAEGVESTQEQTSSSGEVGGIEPVSPDRFFGKIQKLLEGLYGTASPVYPSMAKLSLAAAGILLILLIVLGAGILRQVVGVVFAVALGLTLWYGAPYIVGICKYMIAWLAN